MKIVIYVIIAGIVFSFMAIFMADCMVKRKTKDRIINRLKDVPNGDSKCVVPSDVVLLLGTTKYLQSRAKNPYYTYRIDATVELFERGKIEHIVISGDHSRDDYNEPQDMMNDLIERGVPESCINLDYAGFNTYDSILRMKHIFGQDSFIVVSQRFHCERALYIAHKSGLNAWAYPAQDVDKYFGLKVQLREKLARVKMLLDLLSAREPRFLGEQIELK